jgi:hypothetical protein
MPVRIARDSVPIFLWCDLSAPVAAMACPPRLMEGDLNGG